MVYLVTGGLGFIGSHITAALVRKGRKVRILDNFSTGKLEFVKPYQKHIQIQRGDIRRYRDCEKAMEGVGYVIHQAAFKSVPKSVNSPMLAHEADATGTLNLLEAARQARVKRFVNASSSSVYGDAKHFPSNESDPTKPLSPYGVAKLAAECYAYSYFLNYGLQTVSLRYFNVFGPHQNLDSIYSAVIPAFINHVKSGSSPVIYGTGRQSRDFTYVENVVAANLAAAEAPGAGGHIFNIAGGRAHSVIDLYRELARILDKTDVKPVFKPKRRSDPMRSFADVSAAKKILKWKVTVGFEEGLKRTVEWFDR